MLVRYIVRFKVIYDMTILMQDIQTLQDSVEDKIIFQVSFVLKKRCVI